jgi:glycosyltransferase involved in cell wall biosynthesis
MKLTGVIITFNEERNIERCIKSLKNVCDEIIVLDSFSTDRTEEICRTHEVKFLQHKFDGHIQQKNRALQLVETDWVLSLDADEALTEELSASILNLKQHQKYDAYSFNRLTNYCGHWVKHCGWYPDTKIRLVKKDSAHWTGVNPHDRLEPINKTEIGHLQGDLLHYSYYTKEDHFKQIDYFGNIASKELFDQGKNISVPMLYLKVLNQFIKSYCIKLGILDGKTGFLISIRSAYATYVKYRKLRSLNHQVR